MVEIEVNYEGDLRCRAVHGPSGVTLATDAPVDNQGRGESFSPTDLVATATGACVATILGILARREGWDLLGMRVTVRKHMTTTGSRRIARLETTVRIPDPVRFDAAARERMRRAAETCPVRLSLHPDIDAPITFEW